ncbi:MAG: sterol desaturase family protein [Cyclobacteriaceae bacterium]
MERYAAVLLYAIPFFMLLLIIERVVAGSMGAKVIKGMDTLSSLSSGITNVIKDVLGLTLVIVSYRWFYEHFGLFDIESEWYVYVIAFIGLDFAGYWNHRLSHQVNYFWNVHVIHHSSEEFNLACALRQSISSIFGTLVFFLIPTAVIGVPSEVIAVVAPLHLFAQYWYHTRLINKMGFLEKIIVTPSHHRVHHAINDEYLDKNMSQIFIVWDKLFGTFQEELDNIPPVYGVKKASRTWNPILINFQHLYLLIQDAYRTKSWKDRFRIWFMPTGWRPADVKEKYPIDIIEDVYIYRKYAPLLGSLASTWCWIQGICTFLLMMYMFINFGKIGTPGVYAIGALIYISVFNYSTLMDKHRFAWLTAFIYSFAGIGIILYTGDFFYISEFNTQAPNALLVYFAASFLISLVVIRREAEKKVIMTVLRN